MQIGSFFDEPTGSLTYVVHDATQGVVIDPVRGYDARSGRTSWHGCESVARYIDEARLRIPYVIDTHAHADHITGLPFFRERYGAKSVTGSAVEEIQSSFREFYNLGEAFPTDGSQFDLLLDEGTVLEVGELRVEALHTPGHTPAHMSWRIDDVVFVGDTVFMPDYGSARCDFPGGSAEALFDSIQRLFSMTEETRLFMCHDYQPGGRPLAFESTVGDQKKHNVQINDRTTKEEYVAFREAKDASLAAPALLLQSIQVNIRAGELPEPESNGTVYLKIPVDRLGKR